MASGSTTTRMLEVYRQDGPTSLFMSGYFRSPRRNFYKGEKIEIDIVRSEEDVAIVIQDLSAGYRDNSADVFTNKEFIAPVFKERLPLNAHKLTERMPGQDPFVDPNYRANAIVQAVQGAQKIGAKIMRSIEQQASQVLQTGTVTLTDSSGATLYSINYSPKSSHFPTAGTAWNAGGATIADDIDALAEIIRGDGLSDPDQLIFGIDAYKAFITDADIIQRYDTRRANQGEIKPMVKRQGGGNFRGTINIGNYEYEIWTYGGRFKDPVTGVSTSFLDPAKCIVLDQQARFDATFGDIPNFNDEFGNGRRLLPELPRRMSSAGDNIDLHMNVWKTDDGEQLFVGVGSRPLLIPTAIDKYGCIDSGI